jgi:hypothetical protein
MWGYERGQLFVVGASALAVIVLAVAVLLNSSVYTATIAAHNSEAEVEEPRTFIREAEIGANRIMSYVNNNNNSSYSTLESNFTVGVSNWSTVANHHNALEANGVRVSAAGVTSGTRISQSTWKRSFRNDSGAANWTLGTHLHGVRQFRMNLSVSALRNNSSVTSRAQYRNSSYFRVSITPNGGATHRIYIYRNQPSDRVLLRVESPSGLSTSCSAAVNANGRVTLHLTNGLIDRAQCFPLTFLQDPSVPFRLRYVRGDAIGGSYDLYLNETISGVNDEDFDTPPPRVDRAIYEADLAVSYLDGTARINGTRSVKPDRLRPLRVNGTVTSIPTPTVTPTATPTATPTPSPTATPTP